MNVYSVFVLMAVKNQQWSYVREIWYRDRQQNCIHTITETFLVSQRSQHGD
jgi:hypothetical protein